MSKLELDNSEETYLRQWCVERALEIKYKDSVGVEPTAGSLLKKAKRLYNFVCELKVK